VYCLPRSRKHADLSSIIMTTANMFGEFQRKRSSWNLLARFVLLTLSASAVISMQAQQTVSVSGSVFDPQNKAVARATIKLLRLSARSEQQVLSDATGQFRFESVKTGIYQLTAEAAGFGPASREIAVIAGRNQSQDLQFVKVVSQQSVLVVNSVWDASTSDPGERIFSVADLLAANPGRPGVPVSIPGLPVETSSGGIKAPQYFAPGVAGDHGEPVAQFVRVGDFLLPNNLPANAHGNGYADPNVLIASGIGSVTADSGAFSVREGNNAVDEGITYELRSHLQPFAQVTGDARCRSCGRLEPEQSPNAGLAGSRDFIR
jgi:Carboxypeptidase regulatory-like domain